MSYISVKVEGSDEIRRKLTDIKNATSKRYVRKAVKGGLQPVLSRTMSNAVSMVGGVMGSLIATSLRIRPFRRQKNHSYGMNVQISKDYSPSFVHITKTGKRYYIPTAINYGHLKRGKSAELKTKIKSVGLKFWRTRKSKAAEKTLIKYEYGTDKVPAIPFMRNAADLELGKSAQIFGAILRESLKL